MTMEVLITLESDGADGVLTRTPSPATAITWNGAPCGAATVVGTTAIAIEDTTDDKDTGVVLDMSNGPLENSSGDEIPISVDLGSGNNDTFGVVGTSGKDYWSFGRSGGNLQEDDEAEIEFVSFPDLSFGVTEAGTDRACANGGHGTGGSALTTWVFSGGNGADRLCGGNATDGLFGEGGNDNLRGYGSPDLIKGDAGEDKIFGSSGNDELRGNDDPDEIDGGTGQDLCYGGEGSDNLRRCEIGVRSAAAAVAPARRLMNALQ